MAGGESEEGAWPRRPEANVGLVGRSTCRLCVSCGVIRVLTASGSVGEARASQPLVECEPAWPSLIGIRARLRIGSAPTPRPRQVELAQHCTTRLTHLRTAYKTGERQTNLAFAPPSPARLERSTALDRVTFPTPRRQPRPVPAMAGPSQKTVAELAEMADKHLADTWDPDQPLYRWLRAIKHLANESVARGGTVGTSEMSTTRRADHNERMVVAGPRVTTRMEAKRYAMVQSQVGEP